jgi:hypothetical protein
MKRWAWVMVALMFWQTCSGCFATRKVSTGMAESLPKSETTEGVPISGYTTSDARFHRQKGRARISADSVWIQPSVDAYPYGGRPASWIALPRDSVQTLYVTQFNPVRSVLLVVGITVLAMAIAASIAIATKESCPFIYSWDGQQYVFDGEPYGGATMKSLERTDWSRLEHLAEVNGQYRLMLTNEVDETQHTNSLRLLVVDHPRGTRVVMDGEGRPHAFRSIASLRSASDAAGTDLLPWLRADDQAVWEHKLERLTPRGALADTRDHITLEFDRPPGVRQAHLITHVGTALWGSHMIRVMLGLRGQRVTEFYQAINGNDAFRRQLHEWNEREELYMLGYEVRQGQAWVRQGFILGGGPFMTESRAIPIDLSGVVGDRVQIRIHPPIGFWNLESFQLAWQEDSAVVATVAARSASGPSGVDALGTLEADDDRYLDFPTTKESAELWFDAPKRRSGMERTIFARTRGWYELHLHGLGEPEYAALDSLTNQPGYAVQRALREFALFQRTAALTGVPPVQAR